MKRFSYAWLFSPVFIAVFGLAFISCENPSGGGGEKVDTELADTQKYQSAGADVAARSWSVKYDCSNFSTQFYQNCYKAGLPVRVRSGISGGDGFAGGPHAWNSVKINGRWVDWEPQKNAVHTGHRKTSTPIGKGYSSFTKEHMTKILYESIGKYVPSSVISEYEIDKYLFRKSPFNQYFLSLAECLTENPAANASNASLLSQLSLACPDDGDGVMLSTDDGLHLAWTFNLNNEYYIIVNVEQTDPVEGRQVLRPKSLASDFTELIDLHISY